MNIKSDLAFDEAIDYLLTLNMYYDLTTLFHICTTYNLHLKHVGLLLRDNSVHTATYKIIPLQKRNYFLTL